MPTSRASPERIVRFSRKAALIRVTDDLRSSGVSRMRPRCWEKSAKRRVTSVRVPPSPGKRISIRLIRRASPDARCSAGRSMRRRFSGMAGRFAGSGRMPAMRRSADRSWIQTRRRLPFLTPRTRAKASPTKQASVAPSGLGSLSSGAMTGLPLASPLWPIALPIATRSTPTKRRRSASSSPPFAPESSRTGK